MALATFLLLPLLYLRAIDASCKWYPQALLHRGRGPGSAGAPTLHGDVSEPPAGRRSKGSKPMDASGQILPRLPSRTGDRVGEKIPDIMKEKTYKKTSRLSTVQGRAPEICLIR
jgi:hypothetical protein